MAVIKHLFLIVRFSLTYEGRENIIKYLTSHIEIGYAPSRIVSLVMFIYVLLNIIFSAAPYNSKQPNSWFADTKTEIATYVANRTGVLSFANMALAILFAGRLNPLLHLTGLSQTTCLIFHRWSARVATVQAIVHSIIYTCTNYWAGGSAAYYAAAAEPYYWWGIIATITLSLGIGFSVLPIRLRQYELFLVTHIILAILSIVGCWYHIILRFANDWGYEVWIYLMMAFWGFDRLSRLTLIAYRNMGGSTTQAIAELTPNGDFIKLTVYPAKPWKFRPGQHAFLFLPSTMRFWESHPFSIAAWDNGHRHDLVSTIPATTLPKASSSEDPEKDLTITAHPISSSSSSHATPSAPAGPPSITFLMRPQKGLTAHLHKYLQYDSARKVPLSVTLEGPYGHSANLNNCDAILCIGGGIGITSLLSYVQFFVSQRQSSAANFRPSRLVLNWSHTETGFDNTVRGMLPLDTERFGVELLFTHTTAEGKGRINVQEAVRREVEGVKRLAVVVCAPPGFADEVRQAVVGTVGGGKVVDLHEESFAW
jgi:predicted ferric reductase